MTMASPGLMSPPFSLAAEGYGLSGELPSCLYASLFGLQSFRNYETAVRANIVAAGDNALRAWLLGSMFAAEQGEAAIPAQWKERTFAYSEIHSMANRIAGSNPFFDSLKERSCKFPDF